jgi:hypothetical protein
MFGEHLDLFVVPQQGTSVPAPGLKEAASLPALQSVYGTKSRAEPARASDSDLVL